MWHRVGVDEQGAAYNEPLLLKLIFYIEFEIGIILRVRIMIVIEIFALHVNDKRAGVLP